MDLFDFHHHHKGKRTGIYNLNFGETVPNCFFSAGIHPNFNPEKLPEFWDWLEKVIQDPKCVAVGECGLDGFITTPDSVQEMVFERQIKLANLYNKPIIVHCVKRFPQLINLKKTAAVPLIVHSYNKKETTGKELIKHDFYLSFGQSVLHNVNLQEFVKNFPIEKLFLETDAADFDIEILYHKVANLKNKTIHQIQRQIAQNLKILKI